MSFFFYFCLSRLHGSYQKLDYGHVTDALVDFTGGVAETYDLNINEDDVGSQLNHLMENICHELSSHSIICLKINVSHILLLILFEIKER